MRILKYEIKRFRLGFYMTLGVITLLMSLSIFYETKFEFVFDQIALLIAIFGFLVTTVVIQVKQYHQQQILYFHSSFSKLKKTYYFCLVLCVLLMTLLLYGILIINLKAIIIYRSDFSQFLENGLDHFVFVFLNRHLWEIVMMLFSYIFNTLIISITVTYGIFLVMHKIKYENIYKIKRTLIGTVFILFLIQVFYRGFIYVLHLKVGFLDFNHVHYYDVISYGNQLLFINVFFLPALLIFGFEFYRMHVHVKQMLTEENRYFA